MAIFNPKKLSKVTFLIFICEKMTFLLKCNMLGGCISHR